VQEANGERLVRHRLEVHDRKQLELKLECQPPAGLEGRVRYEVELYLCLPGSLNLDAETYPREDVFADLRSYVRLKTPVLSLAGVLSSPDSPLVALERWAAGALPLGEAEVVARAKLLATVARGALRRFAQEAAALSAGAAAGAPCPAALVGAVHAGVAAGEGVLARYRAWAAGRAAGGLGERGRTALRLVDEYLSLGLEQFLRMAVADMEHAPRVGEWAAVRRELMGAVLREEGQRRAAGIPSVLDPAGDNEEYMHRAGMLKKFCTQALFLLLRRTGGKRNLEEALFALAAGLAMVLATLIGAWAQWRFDDFSGAFFASLVVGYMMKDRAKEALRRAFARVAARHMADRSWEVLVPASPGEKEDGEAVATVREKVEFLTPGGLPEDVVSLRCADELLRAAVGEVEERVLRYRRDVVVDPGALPRPCGAAPGGLTDILRFRVDRLLRGMDEPEFALEYVDLEDFSVGHVRGAKRYRVDVALRVTCEAGEARETSLQFARLVLDREGIQRLDRRGRPVPGAAPAWGRPTPVPAATAQPAGTAVGGAASPRSARDLLVG
jgi:hypothetical protein